MRSELGRVFAAALVALSLAVAYGTSRRALPVLAADDPEPPARLSETGLFAAGRPGVVRPENRPYSPQYPLWTDGASKRRWLSLPPGTAIRASQDGAWEFPVGTRLWKEFSFGERKVETRLLWKTSAAGWVGASYVWNESQSEAVLAPEGGVPGVVEVAPGRRHSVPGRGDCATCHGSPFAPIGFVALQLSDDRDPNAIHGEPLEPGMLTLAVLVREGLLKDERPEIVSAPPRIQATSPRTRSALGYLAVNCGTCHNRGGEIAANLPPLGYDDVLDGDAVARALVGRATGFQVPGAPDGESVVVHPEAPDESALLVRMRSRRPSSQMPPLGSVLRDQAAVDALALWIETDLASERIARR